MRNIYRFILANNPTSDIIRPDRVVYAVANSIPEAVKAVAEKYPHDILSGIDQLNRMSHDEPLPVIEVE